MLVKDITNKQEWQNFIEHEKPSTFLHTWQWGEFERQAGRTVHRIGVYENNTLIAIALLNVIKARRGTFLACPHGPIIKHDYQSRLEEILKIIKEEGIRIGKKEHCDFIRISTLVPLNEENNNIFKKLGFRNAPIHMHSELTSILDLTKSEEELLQGMKKNHRYSIKKAEKDGVTVRQVTTYTEEDFKIFWDMYMSTVARQKFTPFGKEYIKREFTTFSNDNQSVIFFAEYNTKPISAAVVIFANGSAFYHHGASDNTFPGITPSELLQWEAMKEAKKRGIEKYNFWGVVPEDAVNHPWYGLSKFKRGFGGYDEAYVRAQDYILTPKYWISFIIEKVRKYKRRV